MNETVGQKIAREWYKKPPANFSKVYFDVLAADIDRAIAAEREACAQVVENTEPVFGARGTLVKAAAAIRARGRT